MRKLLFSIGTLLYTVTCMGTSKKELPNILFLLVDDMQRTCIHHNGCEQVSTPNIDRIYQNGISFHSTYTNGSLGGALSMPSRAMIMTGRGVFQIVKDGQVIPEQHVTLPELLRQHGYITFETGKWHSDFASFNRSFSNGENIFFGGMHTYETNGHVEPRLNHYDSSGKYREKFAREVA